MRPSAVVFGSKRKVWWLCNKGHDYEQIIWERTGRKKLACPYCSGKKIGYGNDFASLYPKLAREWHPTKNGELTPVRVLSKSKQKAWFRCSKGHDYYQEIYYLTKGHGCPYCSGRKIGYGNDFATLYPDLAKEWHPTKNTDLSPSKISAGSQQKVWWICNKDHEFEAHIRNRTKKKSKCH